MIKSSLLLMAVAAGTMDEMQAASSNDLLHRLAKDRHKRMQKRQEVQLLCSDPCTDGDSLLTALPECGGKIGLL